MLVHVDLAGAIKLASWDGDPHVFVLIDNFSRKARVILLGLK